MIFLITNESVLNYQKEFQIYCLQYFKNICFILLQNDEFKCNGNNDSNL